MLAIGLLLDPSGNRPLGSAFAISPTLALTDCHCVTQKGNVLPGLRIRFDAAKGIAERPREVTAVVNDVDEHADLALLELESIPEGCDPVLLADSMDVRSLRFLIRGYPVNRQFPEMDAIDGHIVDDALTINGIRSLDLFSPQVAALEPKDPHGFSGAPVLVRSSAGGPDLAVGIVRGGEIASVTGKVVGGQLFATPVSSAAKRWTAVRAALRPLAFPAPPRLLPFANAIDNFRGQYLGTNREKVPFGGRQAELAKLTAWLADPDGPVFMLVTAPAGSGKSALLVRWHETLSVPSVFVPISVRYALSGEREVLRAVVSRLALALREPETTASNDLRDEFANLLRHSLPNDQQFVVILDGLDEAQGWEIGPALLPRSPGHGIKTVVSARLTSRHPSAEAWGSALGWSKDSAANIMLRPLSEDGVRDVIASAAPLASVARDDSAVRHLFEQSGGDPLVLSLYLQELSREPAGSLPAAIARLRDQPQGLDGVFNRWWEDQRQIWKSGGVEIGPAVWAVLDVLACSFGPLRRAELLQVTARLLPMDGELLNQAVAALDRFVVGAANTNTYALAHPRLAAHRREKLREDGTLESRHRAFSEWGSQILDAVRAGKLAPAGAAPYAVRHLGDHLEASGAEAEELIGLLDAGWQAAWEATVEDWNSYLVEVGRVAGAVRRTVETTVGAGRQSPIATAAVQCSIVRSAMQDISTLISGDLACELVKRGVWSDRTAVGAVRALKTEWDRVQGAGRLARELGPEAIRVAADLMAEVNPVGWELEYGGALGALAVRWAELFGDEDAVRMLAARTPSCGRATALLTLLKARQSSGDRGAMSMLIEDLVAIKEGRTKADTELVLDRVADSVSATMLAAALDPARSGDQEVAIRFLRSCRRRDGHDGSAFGIVDIGPLAPWLPPKKREQEISRVLNDVEEDWDREDSSEGRSASLAWAVLKLNKVAKWLPPEQARRALRYLAKAETTEGSYLRQGRSLLRLALAERLPSAEQAAAIEPLLKSLDELVDRTGRIDQRIAILRGLGQLGAGSEVLAGLSDASENRADFWADALGAVAPWLGVADTRRGLNLVGKFSPLHRDEALAPLLARLATFGTQEAGEALQQAARPMDDHGKYAVSALVQAALERNELRQQPQASGHVPALNAVGAEKALRAVLAMLAKERTGSPSGAWALDVPFVIKTLDSIDRVGVELVRSALEEVDSMGIRDRLRSAVAIRLAQLGDYRAGLEVAAYTYQKVAVPAYWKILKAVPDSDLDDWLKAVQSRFNADLYWDERRQLSQLVRRRLIACNLAEAWSYLVKWLERDGTRAERLIDLEAYAPVVATVAGPTATIELADWLKGSPATAADIIAR